MTDAMFCTPGPGVRFCKDGHHTNACRRRELLGMRVVRWLREGWDQAAALDPIDAMPRFMMDLSVQFVQQGADLPVSNMVLGRLIPDFGDFLQTYTVAHEIVSKEKWQATVDGLPKVKGLWDRDPIGRPVP